ncbi:MAG: nitrilase-related carbon-nitrogen hydrolase, partial [Solirubrobacteraceae bacterium]
MPDHERSLPILAVQAPFATSEDPLREFAADVRARLALFPRSRLVVYPELHLTAPGGEPHMRRLAEPVPGPRSDALCALAAELGVWLVPGTMYERGDGDRIHN